MKMKRDFQMHTKLKQARYSQENFKNALFLHKNADFCIFMQSRPRQNRTCVKRALLPLG